MKKLRLAFVAALALIVGLSATPVFAEAVTSFSETLTTIAKDKTVDGSAYLAGDTVTVEGTVHGDLYCLGNKVTVTGTVQGDVLCAASDMTISGVVQGNVRAFAVNMTLKGLVDGSVTLNAMKVVTESASKIGKDAVVNSTNLSLAGMVGRDVMIGNGGVVRLDGIVGRDVQGSVQDLHVASSAKIAGNMTYTSDRAFTIPQGVVSGKTTQHMYSDGGMFGSAKASFATLALMALAFVVGFVVTTMLVVFAAPRYVHRVSDLKGVKQFAFAFLVGLVSLFVAPMIFVMCMVTLVGAYAAAVLAVAELLALLVGATLVAYRLGRFMLPTQKNAGLIAIVGATVLGIMSLIPVIGWLLGFVAVMTGTGMILLSMKDQHAQPAAAEVESDTAVVAKPAKKKAK